MLEVELAPAAAHPAMSSGRSRSGWIAFSRSNGCRPRSGRGLVLVLAPRRRACRRAARCACRGGAPPRAPPSATLRRVSRACRRRGSSRAAAGPRHRRARALMRPCGSTITSTAEVDAAERRDPDGGHGPPNRRSRTYAPSPRTARVRLVPRQDDARRLQRHDLAGCRARRLARPSRCRPRRRTRQCRAAIAASRAARPRPFSATRTMAVPAG